MNNLLKTFALPICLTLAAASAFSQGGWEGYYNVAQNQFLPPSIGKVIQTQDQGYAGLIARDSVSSILIKVDPDGILQWVQEIDNAFNSTNLNALRQATNGDYLLAGHAFTNGWQQRRALVLRLDPQGNLVWKKDFAPTGLENLYDLVELPDGSIYACGESGWATQNAQTYTLLLDADGNLIDQLITQDVGVAKSLLRLFPTPDGGALFAGSRRVPNPTNTDYYLERRNAAGAILWNVNSGDVSQVHDAGVLPNGDVIILSSCTVNNQLGFCLTRLDGDGNFVSEKNYQFADFNTQSLNQFYFALSVENNGNVYVTISDNFYGTIIKLNETGNVLWFEKTLYLGGGLTNTPIECVAATMDGGCIAGGYFRPDFSIGEAYLIKLDSTGALYSNAINGKVFFDENADCNFNGIDEGMQHRIVKAVGNQTFYGSTDGDGNYSIEVPAGSYVVSASSPVPFSTFCENDIPVTLTNPTQTAMVNFADSVKHCSVLQVDMYSWTMRRCQQNKYMGKVCNIGVATDEDAVLQVELDPWLEFVSADLLLISQSGQLLYFSLGNLAPGECIDFKIFFFLKCDVPQDLTHCSKATAFPDSLCMPGDSTWDGSSIRVDGFCLGDTIVQLRLRNLGFGDMQQQSNLLVIEDHMIMFQDFFQLPIGGEQSLQYPATGATYRLEAAQSPGHPGSSMPSVTVEGCGAGNGQVISTGYVNMFPMNDADPWIDIDCRKNTGSYDPNMKEAYPAGYMEDHLVERSTGLSYLIQFQNTGTDTAFLVVIRDTLSPFLDPSTIRPGAASHPYVFKVDGLGVAKFAFPDIMLPDSNVNEPMSHGFVSFRIDQKPGLANGTVIKNTAAIFFDHNAPVITNETFHTVGENFILVSVDEPPSPDVPRVIVSPNPFSHFARFYVPGMEYEKLTLTLYDSSGKLVKQVDSLDGAVEFQRESLLAGLYFFKIYAEKGFVGSGKMIAR